MRPKFRNTLETFGDIAKDSLSAENRDEIERLEHVLEWNIERASKARGSTPEAQQSIYKVQVQKQRIMKRLKEQIAQLDGSEYRPRKGARATKYSEGKLYSERDGKIERVSIGELMTDGEWGVRYDLGDQNIPRNVRKRYLIEEAKRELRDYLNRQIIIDESSSVRASNSETYERIGSDEQAEHRSGLIAEKMVQTFLQAIAYDTNADFEIVKTDIYQDVEQKIDFVIKRKWHERGVKVREEPEGEGKLSLGVQFTINDNPDIQEKKKRQLNKARNSLVQKGDVERLRPGEMVESLVLVALPALEVRNVYNEWLANPAPGGPAKLWSRDTKVEIFMEVMKGILSAKEIEDYLDRIS